LILHSFKKSKNFLFSIKHNSWIFLRILPAKSEYLMVLFWWKFSSLRIEIITCFASLSSSKLFVSNVLILWLPNERLFFNSWINWSCLLFGDFCFIFDFCVRYWWPLGGTSPSDAFISWMTWSVALEIACSLFN